MTGQNSDTTVLPALINNCVRYVLSYKTGHYQSTIQKKTVIWTFLEITKTDFEMENPGLKFQEDFCEINGATLGGR
jgi:hypothetical protein